MIFRPELARAVMDGRKTVTRRLCNDNPRSPWWREVCGFSPGGGPNGTYAVQMGRALPAVGRIRVLDVRRETLLAMRSGSGLCSEEASLEGFASFEAFREAWVAINGSWAPLAEVWRVRFERA